MQYPIKVAVLAPDGDTELQPGQFILLFRDPTGAGHAVTDVAPGEELLFTEALLLAGIRLVGKEGVTRVLSSLS